jgi:hypothetical protein
MKLMLRRMVLSDFQLSSALVVNQDTFLGALILKFIQLERRQF